MNTQTASPDRRSHRRFRLATNQNETIVLDDADDDVEGHRLATNDNETVVEGTRDPDEVEDEVSAPGARRLARK
ncbi:MAG TPA: hypothetical protein VHK05_02120 [Candidatus Limnocylindrales bacterium]|jgi:hypothetical protein|nr:hypothetical protein [Candidatus Limnocylindrales bacterium]